jgi:hypothetical protein
MGQLRVRALHPPGEPVRILVRKHRRAPDHEPIGLKRDELRDRRA